MRLFGRIFKVLLILFLLVVVLGAAGYMRVQALKEPGRAAPYAETPKIHLFSEAAGLIEREVEAAGFTPEYVDYDESDIGIYIVLDWEALRNLPGLYEYCGEHCASGEHLTLQRIVTTTNALKVRKDVFINMNDFADYDRQSQKITYDDDQLACLRETLRREITYLSPVGDTTLNCQMKGAQKQVTDGTIVSTSIWEDNLDFLPW